MPEPDIAAIAKGLTKAQREAMLKQHGNSPNWLARARLSTTEVLYLRSLIDWPEIPARLTPLGLSVRAYLMENGDETLVDSTR